jgi:hypothetical protein
MSATTSTGTLTPFTPTATSVFTFGATLDGTNYICSVRWNLWAQRWYLFITDTSGNPVLTRALIASPPGFGINMIYGLFTSSVMYFWDLTQTFETIP